MVDIKTRYIDIEDESLNCIIEYPVITSSEDNIFIKNINKKIYEDINIFKDISKEEVVYSNEKSTIFIDYETHLNKNNIISISIVFSEIYKNNHIINYINIYNYDLKNEKKILIEDIFNKKCNYEKLIESSIKNQIKELPQYIACDLSFYITSKYISINFSSYEILNSNEITNVKLYFGEIKEFLSDYTRKYLVG
ncbi:MAG: hypothetical protein E6902_03685 [Paeniclostridium sordellii]|nr:hypothetical protein [Paeniclostridium sordellii]